eukprot:4843553-Pleurochrysis_carterae.AAC.1
MAAGARTSSRAYILQSAIVRGSGGNVKLFAAVDLVRRPAALPAAHLRLRRLQVDEASVRTSRYPCSCGIRSSVVDN